MHGSESWMLYVILYSSAGGNHPHYVGVHEPRGKGHVSGVQGRGSRGGEFKTEEGVHFCYGRGQHHQGEG